VQEKHFSCLAARRMEGVTRLRRSSSRDKEGDFSSFKRRDDWMGEPEMKIG